MQANEELYRALYSKYAPNLSQQELQQKLEYALTLDVDDFISSFYQKYTGKGPDQKQLDYINSIVGQPDLKPVKKQKEEENERSALDILKSYPASFYLRGTEMINNFVKGYETGEGTEIEIVAKEIIMENPFVASYGYAAEYLRGKGYDIPDEFMGMDLTTPKQRREIYEQFLLDSREKGMPIEQFQKLDPTNKIKFEEAIEFFQKHTYQPKDENGKPIDYAALWGKGEILKGTDAFLNDIAGAIPSLIVSRLPYGTGAAFIGSGAYMENFEREAYKRGFNDETTRDQIVMDSMITGAADFVTQFIGGFAIK